MGERFERRESLVAKLGWLKEVSVGEFGQACRPSLMVEYIHLGTKSAIREELDRYAALRGMRWVEFGRLVVLSYVSGLCIGPAGSSS